MKKVVLLVAVLALCASSFGATGDANDPNLAVLVYKVASNVSAAEYTDANYTDAELTKGKVEGYAVARFNKTTLETYTDEDPNNDPTFILVDKKAKEFVVLTDGDDYQTVEIFFADKEDPIFNVLNSKGKDTKKDYIWGWLWVDVDDPNTENRIFELDVWDGLTQITSSVIDNANTKILVPKNVKFNNGEASVDMNLLWSYKAATSAKLDSKYTKSSNGGGLKVKGAAALIAADLIDKKYTAVTAKEFFTWDD
jgi:hypothetical protein